MSGVGAEGLGWEGSDGAVPSYRTYILLQTKHVHLHQCRAWARLRCLYWSRSVDDDWCRARALSLHQRDEPSSPRGKFGRRSEKILRFAKFAATNAYADVQAHAHSHTNRRLSVLVLAS